MIASSLVQFTQRQNIFRAVVVHYREKNIIKSLQQTVNILHLSFTKCSQYPLFSFPHSNQCSTCQHDDSSGEV